MKTFKIEGGTGSCGRSPDSYRTDPYFYREEIEKAVEALKQTSFNYMVKRGVATPSGAVLQEVDEDTWEVVAWKDRTFFDWKGPHLRVYAGGNAHLFWERITGEEMWIAIPCGMAEGRAPRG